MPNRSTRESISNCPRRVLTLLLSLSLSAGLVAAEVIPYEVTAVDRFSSGRVHGRDAYEGKGRGDRDWEPLPEVRFVDYRRHLPPVQVVYPSPPPPVQQVEVRPEPMIALVGEDRIFDRIRLDMDIQRCIFRNICTEEVKAIPGVYFGDEQEGDGDWTGRAEPAPADAAGGRSQEQPSAQDQQRAPGRVFVEETAGKAP